MTSHAAAGELPAVLAEFSGGEPTPACPSLLDGPIAFVDVETVAS